MHQNTRPLRHIHMQTALVGSSLDGMVQVCMLEEVGDMVLELDGMELVHMELVHTVLDDKGLDELLLMHSQHKQAL